MAARLDELAEQRGADYGVKLETAYECGWSCEIRWTAEPNTPGPDESIVFYAAGGTPEDCMEDCLVALRTALVH